MEKKTGFLGVLFGLANAPMVLVTKTVKAPIKVVKAIKKK